MVKGWAVLITLSLLAGPVHAELRLPVTSLADTELDQLRGGFVMNNLEISIDMTTASTIEIHAIHHGRPLLKVPTHLELTDLQLTL